MSASPYAPPPGWTAPAPGPPRPPGDAWSVVSLCTGLLGLTLVGLVCGVVGLVRTTGGRRRGRGLAVAGLVVSALLLVVQTTVLVAVGPELLAGARDGVRDARQELAAVPETTTAEDGPAGAPAAAPTDAPAAGAQGEVVDVDDLAVGDCFADPAEGTFYEITVLPCDVPHDGEVLTQVTLEGERYPGLDELEELAWETCLSAVADLLDPAGVDTTGLDYWTFTPTKESWVLYDDREADCLVYRVDGPLEAPVLP